MLKGIMANVGPHKFLRKERNTTESLILYRGT